MIKKIILSILFISGSIWITPVSLIVGTRAAMEAVCRLNHCTRDIKNGDSPHPQFEVMVRLPSEHNEVTSVLLSELPSFREKHPDALFSMEAPEGVTRDESWKFNVRPLAADSQIITAHHQEGNAIDVTYQVTGNSVQPLYSKMMNFAYMIFSLPVGFCFALITRAMSKRALKKQSD